VLQVNKYHFVKGGADKYYLDIAASLRRHGFRVHCLAMQHERNEQASPDDAFVSESDYHAAAGIGRKLKLASRVIYNRESAATARQLVERRRPDVAHLHNVYHQLSPSVVSALSRSKVPMVQTLHDYKLVCPGYTLRTGGEVCERCRGGRYYEAVRNRCVMNSTSASLLAATEAYIHGALGTYGRIARFLCPSRFMMDKVASFGIPREKLVHLPYFLPVEAYQPASEAPENICLYAGRLSPEKGVATLIEAMARVAGEGPLRPQLEELAQRRCPGRVRFLGYLSGEEFHDRIRRAAFSVVPSEWYENYPLAILECFALGRPVVGARIGGIPEMVIDGHTGRLHESGNAASLAEALQWMMSGEADLRAMGANARRFIETEHSEDQHIARLSSIYDEVIQEARRN
jgi:glycosyltransferase involved in cell wall biosynthesis